jgi:GTP-binding protein
MEIKNLAIIAHVDHGKTTLVDMMLTQAGGISESKAYDRMMDSGDLERERGITILAKCTSVQYEDYKLNIIDTPGHADFGGEVERVLSMVDGVLLLVDAAEGPMPQTKFVLTKALKLGLKPIVVLNKVDKPTARADEVLDEIFDLFIALGATDEQADFKTIYASGKEGWASNDLSVKSDNLTPLFKLIINEIKAPSVDKNAPFSMLVSIIDYDQYLGRILIGKIYAGEIKRNTMVKSLKLTGEQRESTKVTKLLTFHGLQKVVTEHAVAGDIVALAGLEFTKVSDTICSLDIKEPLHSTPVDPPTISITIAVNNSPLAGQSGDKVTSRLIRDRLLKEAEGNVAITFNESADKDAFEIGGRGELQLGVLFETMRREGFEIGVSRPRVLYKEENGKRLEPIEEVQVDVDDEFSGVVIEKISARGGEIKTFEPSGAGKKRLIFVIPTKNIIGYQGELLSDTRGTAVMNKTFLEYREYKNNLLKRKNGVLISMVDGVAAAYALANLESRGELFISHQDKVYQGMIIGIHNLSNDLEVNPCKGKQLTNMRTTMKDEAIKLKSPKEVTIENSISFIEDDEMLEVTPNALRLRKRFLDPNVRKRNSK